MLANLRALFGVIVDIVLLRRGPEHLPVSQALLGFTIALSTIASAFMGVATGLPFAEALLQAIVGSVLLLVWFRVGLIIVNKRERLVQTMTALFAINAVFMPLLIPLVSAMMPYMQTPDPATPPPAGPMFAASGIALWALIAEARVVKSAFEIPWIGALLIIFGEFFAAGVVGMLIFGGPAKPV